MNNSDHLTPNLGDALTRIAELENRLETLRALCDAADHIGIVSGGWFTVEAVRRATAGRKATDHQHETA